MTLYTLTALAKAAAVSDGTLRRWRRAGWLRPSAMVGQYERYTMDDFKAACERSLIASYENTHDAGIYKRIASSY